MSDSNRMQNDNAIKTYDLGATDNNLSLNKECDSTVSNANPVNDHNGNQASGSSREMRSTRNKLPSRFNDFVVNK